jgi:AAA domain
MMVDELDRVVAEIEARQAQRLGALSRSDSLALIEDHQPEWRVHGIFSTDDYGVLAGPKGVGKTFALIDLAVAVSLGERWFGRFETVQARVLLLTSEDSRARLWRRADAVATWLGQHPAKLEGQLFVHPLSFSVVDGLPALEAELAALDPGLVLLDPAYRYMNGVRAQLFDMGAVLTPLQETCREAGAPLLIGHHFNRQEGKAREERISGAGLLEWARLVITATAPPRRVDDPDVIVTFELSGNSIDPLTFRVRRQVVKLDESPNPEISYSAEVIAEGSEAVASRYLTAAERVLAVLPVTPEDALTVREIGDLVAHDDTGKGGVKHDNIRRALNRDLDGQVDKIGELSSTRWWRT